MAVGVDVVQANGVRVRRDADAESRVVPVFEGPSGDPEEQRDMVRLVVRDREVGDSVLVEIRDGQVHRVLAAGAGPRHLEAAVAPTGQHEDALAAGNHEVKPPVAIQIASPDRGGGASDDGVDPTERELCGGVGRWGRAGGGGGSEDRECEGGPGSGSHHATTGPLRISLGSPEPECSSGHLLDHRNLGEGVGTSRPEAAVGGGEGVVEQACVESRPSRRSPSRVRWQGSGVPRPPCRPRVVRSG